MIRVHWSAWLTCKLISAIVRFSFGHDAIALGLKGP
jgi:hypothetical protein